MFALETWLATQPRGAKTQLMYDSGLSWTTVCRACKGENVSLRAALLLSEATGGVVSASLLSRETSVSQPRRRRGRAA